MKETDYIHPDPNDLEIDPVNERKSGVHPQEGEDSLVQSIKKKGVIEPIVVREQDGTYYVVAGQRRTLAAQIAGEGEIPARVMEMNDTEARIVSITENAESLDRDVSAEDRARAVAHLRDDEGWSQSKIAEELGFSQPTISKWLEPARPEWAGTDIDPDTDGEISADDIPNQSLIVVRKNSSNKNHQVELAKFIKENNIKISLVERAADRAGSPEEFEENLQQIAEEQQEGRTVIRTSVRFTEDTAEQIKKIMKHHGKSADEVIERLAEKGLEELNV